MKCSKLAIVSFSILLMSSAFAETFEVKMLNSGTDGVMVFEPAVLKVNTGDTDKSGA